MAQYIPKDILINQIEEIIADETESIKSFERSKNVSEVQRSNARIGVLMHIRSLLNTFEAKEIDLEKEITLVEEKYHGFESLSRADIINVATHFFELGMQQSNNDNNNEE